MTIQRPSVGETDRQSDDLENGLRLGESGYVPAPPAGDALGSEAPSLAGDKLEVLDLTYIVGRDITPTQAPPGLPNGQANDSALRRQAASIAPSGDAVVSPASACAGSLREREKVALAFVMEHPGCATLDVAAVLDMDTSNVGHLLGALYSRRLLGRQRPLKGIGSLHTTWWPEVSA